MKQNSQTESEAEITIDIVKLLYVIRKNLLWILAAAILFGLVGYAYAQWILPEKYTAVTSFYVKNSTTTTQDEAIRQEDLAASKSLTSTYIVILQDNIVVREVGEKLLDEYGKDAVAAAFPIDGDTVSVKALQSCISMEAKSDTEVLQISACTESPMISAAICDIYVEVAPAFLTRIIGAGSVEVIGAAEIPTAPSSPNKLKIAGLAFAIGLLCAIGVALLHHLLDKTVKNESDLERFATPFLGGIPADGTDKRKKWQLHRKKTAANTVINRKALLSEHELSFSAMECYRAVRMNLTFALSPKKHNSFAVTSANASEGKSTIAANLAYIYAMAGKHILLIDADLRKPMQHHYLQLENRNGLSEILAKTVSFSEAVHRNAAKNLDVLTSGTCPPNPSELLSSHAMQSLLTHAETQYDYVIVDTPPINVVTDGLALSENIGGYILVVRAKETKKDAIAAALQGLSVTAAQVLGFVLNNTEAQGSSYGKYGTYSKYAAHYGEVSEKAVEKQEVLS